MKVLSITHRRVGLGTKIQRVIHVAVDASPLPAKTKAAIKGCGGCGRRAQAINTAETAVRRMLSQNPVAPGEKTAQNAENHPAHADDPNR